MGNHRFIVAFVKPVFCYHCNIFLWVLHKTPSLLIRDCLNVGALDDNKLGLSWPDRFKGVSCTGVPFLINHMEMKFLLFFLK